MVCVKNKKVHRILGNSPVPELSPKLFMVSLQLAKPAAVPGNTISAVHQCRGCTLWCLQLWLTLRYERDEPVSHCGCATSSHYVGRYS